MTRHRQKTNGSAKDILRCRSDLKLFNYQKSTVKDQLELQLKLSVRGGGESSGSLNTFIICAAGHRYDIFRYINQEPNLGYVLERQYRLLGFLS